MAVLGTIDDDGAPQGSIVYICPLRNQTVCFITKNATQKYANLTQRPTVSLTIGNVEDNSTLQMAGQAYVIDDPSLIDAATKKITAIHARMIEWLPPLAKLRAGGYVVVGVKVTSARLAAFKGKDIGSGKIFTKI